MRLARFFTASILVVGLTFLTGCGEDKEYSAVTGVVTMEGQPVVGATLVFYASDAGGEGGSGRTDAQGKYTVTSPGAKQGGTGLKPGSYKVTVAKYEDVVDEDQAAYDKGEITYDELQERKAKKGAYAKSAAAKLLTPEKFSNTNATTLTVTVSKDAKANVFDFNLDE